MTTEVKFRRGTTAQHAVFTGAAGEMTLDTDKDRLIVHDGAEAGGFEVPNVDDIQAQAMVYAAASGTDTITVTLAPVPAAYVAGMRVSFKAANNNTGAATLNVNGLGAKTLKKNGGVDDLLADDIVAGQIVSVEYDGTDFQVTSGTGGVAAGRGIAKVWVKFDLTGAVNDSENVDSVSDTGTGDWTVNITTDFSDADYTVIPGIRDDAGGDDFLVRIGSQAAGSFQFLLRTPSAETDPAAADDMHAVAFGDQ